MTKTEAEMSLHEIRCFIQRQRMGIAESIPRETNTASQSTDIAVGFIKQHFSIDECMRYVADKNAENNFTEVCFCGQKQSHHLGQTGVDEQSSNWTEKDIVRFSGSNAFGSIIFRDENSATRKPSRFLRVGCRLSRPGFLDAVHRTKNSKDMLDVIDKLTWETVDDVLYFFKDDWQLFNPIPNLAVAVIGGAKQFKLDSKRVDTFSRGLIKVAISTHAWILSGGCNYGIMKIVGDCVREGQTMDTDSLDDFDTTARIRCIGITPWGYIKDRENLVIRSKYAFWNRRPQTAYGQRSSFRTSGVSIASGRPQQPDEEIPAANLCRAYDEPVRMYTSVKSGKSEAYLNPDHSHFVFVDNGYRNHKCIHDSLFMMCLLQRLTSGDVFDELPKDVRANDYAIPAVVIVVEGGQAVVDTVFFAVHINIPVVICLHTGRAADVFAAAVEIMLDMRSAMANPDKDPEIPKRGSHHFTTIHKKVAKAFFKGQEESKQDDIDRITQRVFEAAVKTQLITLFDLTARDDFDSAILLALLKVERTDKTKKSENDFFDQLELALTWDRADIAEEKILPYYPKDDEAQKKLQEKLPEVMKTALLKMKLGFVTLLINHGLFSLKEFLTVDVLAFLYKSAIEKDKYLPRLLTKFRRLKGLGRNNDKQEPADEKLMAIYWRFLADLVPFYESPSYDDNRRLSNPYRELFLWAVLLNRVNMATYFWEKIDRPIISALMAALMSKSLADRADEQDNEVADGYNEAKVEFERLATELINKCALIDHHISVIVLERIHPDWDNTTCLQTAALADCKKFVGSAVCQDVLNQRWKRKIVSQWPSICLGIILSPLVPLIVKFDFGDSTNKSISLKLTRLFDLYRNSSQVDDITIAATRAAEEKAASKNGVTLKDIGRRYHRFFKAPVTKFCFSTMTSCIFLCLYFYVLLFAYHDPANGYNRSFEYLLHAWVFTLLCEVVHEIFRFPVNSFKRKASFWWRSVWNKAEASAVFFYGIAFILRLIARTMDFDINFSAKVFFAFALFIFCAKLLRVLNASTTLGPQLVMIGNMLVELVPFLVLTFLFLIAFGVTHAAFYYNESLTVVYDNFKFILTFSFWSLMSGPDLSEIIAAEEREQGIAEEAYCQDSQCPDNSTDIFTVNITTTLLAIGNLSNNSLLEVGNSSAVMTFPKSADGGQLEAVATSWLLSAYLAFWILISVLLVNLLIAIFSNVYNEVNQNSNEIWKYYQYQMITEFENKQSLPPPLSFLGLVWRLSKRFGHFLLAYCCRPGDEKILTNCKKQLLVEEQADQHDPALHFEHETRAAMIRDNRRKEKHGGVVNKLADIHNQLATIRDQVGNLGRLETIAEAAVVEADNDEVKPNESKENDPSPVLSAKKVKTRVVPAATFNPPPQPQLTFSDLERRVDSLTERIAKVQKLAVDLAVAIKSRKEMAKLVASVEKKEVKHLSKRVSFEDLQPPTPPPPPSTTTTTTTSRPLSVPVPPPSPPLRQLVLPVAGVGLAAVPRPILQQNSYNSYCQWPSSSQQVILDYDNTNQLTRRQVSPRK